MGIVMDSYNNVEQITRMVLQAIESAKGNESVMKVPVGVSARHIHLTQQDVEKLFGEGYQLTKKKELMGGQFAANEQCTVVGLKLRAIENVRILGPVRKQSQVEISATDARTLGVNAPLRESGDTKGSAPVALVGPKGVVYLDEGCIVAARHIHMTPAPMISIATRRSPAERIVSTGSTIMNLLPTNFSLFLVENKLPTTFPTIIISLLL